MRFSFGNRDNHLKSKLWLKFFLLNSISNKSTSQEPKGSKCFEDNAQWEIFKKKLKMQNFYKSNLFLAASSAQSSKKKYVVVVVFMDFQSQHLSKKKGKVASDDRTGSMNEDLKMGA